MPMKKTVLWILAAVCLLYAGFAFAQTTLPADSVLISSGRDDGLNEERYWSESEQTYYELHFDDQKELVEMETERKGDRGGKNVVLQEGDIRAQAQSRYPDAAILSVTLERDDGLYEYKVYLEAPTYQGVADFHPESGLLLESNVTYQPKAGGPISADQARQIAITKAGGGQVVEMKLDKDDGRQTYEGELVNGKTRYEFEIDALTGSIIDWERDD